VTSSARHNTITYATQIHKPKKNDELMLCCTYTNAAKHGVSTTDIHGSGSQLVWRHGLLAVNYIGLRPPFFVKTYLKVSTFIYRLIRVMNHYTTADHQLRTTDLRYEWPRYGGVTSARIFGVANTFINCKIRPLIQNPLEFRTSI